MPSSMGAQITELLASTAEISNLMSVLSVLAAPLPCPGQAEAPEAGEVSDAGRQEV